MPIPCPKNRPVLKNEEIIEKHPYAKARIMEVYYIDTPKPEDEIMFWYVTDVCVVGGIRVALVAKRGGVHEMQTVNPRFLKGEFGATKIDPSCWDTTKTVEYVIRKNLASTAALTPSGGM